MVAGRRTSRFFAGLWEIDIGKELKNFWYVLHGELVGPMKKTEEKLLISDSQGTQGNYTGITSNHRSKISLQTFLTLSAIALCSVETFMQQC